MISIVLYGRNDSYGYNLHKRAALGINCLAEVLSDPNDEIIFVDYNTPDDHPTFPEAIGDTLTDRAVDRLRVLRVRPAIHHRVRSRTHLKAIEPIARNVAVRRSNPQNRWILSTNTDMILVPRGPRLLSDIAGDLPHGFYHLPRFELPESLWEGFDRKDPVGVIDQVRTFGRTMFLNEIVYGADCIKYDAPGDFQLILRDDLFRIDGFNEDMLLGWHVDSNIAKRLYLMYGVVGDVVDQMFGYHCDHTRQVTPMHQHKAASNDARVFIDTVTEPRLPHQAFTWGCPHDQIEEIRLRTSAHHVYVQGLKGVLRGEWREPVEAYYTTDSYGRTSYDAQHIMPFLTDLFVSAPRHWTLAWVGGRADSFGLFCDVWRRFGFRGDVLIASWSWPLLSDPARPFVKPVERAEIDRLADVLVFDFGPASDSADGQLRVPADPDRFDAAVDQLVRESFRHLVSDEREKLRQGADARRFVCIHAVHNVYEFLTREEISSASTPFGSRLRHGFVIPKAPEKDVVAFAETPVELIDRMHVGQSGRRIADGIRARIGRRGYLVTGPDALLPAGDYEVVFKIRPGLFSAVALIRPIIIEVVAGSECLIQKHVTSLFRTSTSLRFSVSDACFLRQGVTEFRLLRGRSVDFVITSISLRQLAPSIPPPGTNDVVDTHRLFDLLSPPGELRPRGAPGGRPASRGATASERA